MTFDPYDNSLKQVNEAYTKAKAARYEPITLLNDIHKLLAKSSLPADEYNEISMKMLDVKKMLYERL